MNYKKKLFIHGGSSLISKYGLKKLINDFDQFYIFCRNIEKSKLNPDSDNFKDKEFFFFSEWFKWFRINIKRYR